MVSSSDASIGPGVVVGAPPIHRPTHDHGLEQVVDVGPERGPSLAASVGRRTVTRRASVLAVMFTPDVSVQLLYELAYVGSAFVLVGAACSGDGLVLQR